MAAPAAAVTRLAIVALGLAAFSCPVKRDARSLAEALEPNGALDGAARLEERLDRNGLGDAGANDPRADEDSFEDRGVEVSLDSGPLEGFFTALREMEDRGEGIARVVHWGDSHTAADVITTAIRRPLQERFGDGGRGFVLLGKPWPSYRPRDVIATASGAWQAERIKIALDPVLLDGKYGLGGVTVEASDAGAIARVATVPGGEWGGEASVFEVFYMVRPAGGSFEVLVDGEVEAAVNTRGEEVTSGFVRLEMDEGRHEMAVRVVGDGPVRLFGAVVENDGPGLVYDALGVNGAFFYTPLRWDGALLEEQVTRRRPDLIVTMYGANEADSRSITPGGYKAKVLDVMERLRAGAPEASCLILGPPDREFDVSAAQREERLAWIGAVQREVAEEIGCAFLDLREMMGGPGSHRAWSHTAPPLAQPDGVHLTVRGYEELGGRVAAAILEAFETWSKGGEADASSDETEPGAERAGLE